MDCWKCMGGENGIQLSVLFARIKLGTKSFHLHEAW